MLRQTRIIRFYVVVLPLWPPQSFLPTAVVVAGHRITAGGGVPEVLSSTQYACFRKTCFEHGGAKLVFALDAIYLCYAPGCM